MKSTPNYCEVRPDHSRMKPENDEAYAKQHYTDRPAFVLFFKRNTWIFFDEKLSIIWWKYKKVFTLLVELEGIIGCH